VPRAYGRQVASSLLCSVEAALRALGSAVHNAGSAISPEQTVLLPVDETVFEGTNEINRLIIPATLLKRAGQKKVDYLGHVDAVKREVAAGTPAQTAGDVRAITEPL
jgi:hypothetical protein